MMLDIRAWSPRARKVAAMGFAVCMILHSIVMIGLQLMDVTIPDIRTECEILSAEYRYTSERPFNDYDLRVTTVQTVLGAETWAATLDDDGFPTGSAANLFVSTKWTGNDTADIAALVGQRHSCFTRGRQRRLYRMGNSESYEVDDDLNLAVLSVISLCFMVPVYAGLFLIPSMRAYGPMINMVMFMAAFDFLWLILVLSMLYPSDKHCGVIAARTTGDGIVSIWTHVYRNGVGARVPQRLGSKPFAIVSHLEEDVASHAGEIHADVARAAVLEGVVHGLLGDAVEMRRGGDVTGRRLSVRLAMALDAVFLGRSGGQLLQGGQQALSAESDWVQAAADPPRLRDGLVQQGPDGLGSGRFGAALRAKRLFERVELKSRPDELLTEPIMDVLTDPGLFAVADLQDLPL